ncbi:MAG: sortase [Bacilli bacterium]|nr:sortase [Bacilli bacterium]
MEKEYKVAIIGALFTLIGGIFLFYNFAESKKILAYDYMAHRFYEDAQEEETVLVPQEVVEGEDLIVPVEESGLSDQVSDQYIGYLTIPKINFTKGFLDNRSLENDVEKNIMVVEGSNYPDVEKGNFIIAGHSGTGWKAFFNNLYQLIEGDIVYVDYKGKRYTYQIQSIYTQPKVGKLAIYRNYHETTLTLITCTNDDSTTQTVYVANLIDVKE